MNGNIGIPNVGPSEQEGPFLSLPGGFSLAHSGVPFFASSLRAEEASQVVKMPGDLPVDEDTPVVLSELFQRQVDRQHVDGLKRYLKDRSQSHFVNALTVVLLPTEETPTGKRIAREYPEGKPIRLPQLPGYEPGPIGGVQMHRQEGNASHVWISWDRNEIMPVVLDGQHRLLAIRELLGESFPGHEELATSRLPILFLVLDRRAGFTGKPERSVLSVCRSIFIDLNDHPKPVSTSRKYLLNDSDLIAVCTRSVIAESVSKQDWQVGVLERILSSGRLPLALIDWQSNSAKFDTPTPAITSLQNLHTMVDGLIDVRPHDPEDYDKAYAFARHICLRLLDGEEVDDLYSKLEVEISRCAENLSPFRLPDTAVARLASGFARKYGPQITRTLAELQPYASMISALESREWLGTSIEALHSLEEQRGQPALLRQLEIDLDPRPSIRETCHTVKNEWPLAYQVVFQRAIVQATNNVLSAAGAFDESGWNLSLILEMLNTRVAPLLRDKPSSSSPFVGAGLRSEGTVDYRKTRVAAIAGFITLLVLSPSKLGGRSETDKWVGDALGHSGRRGRASSFESAVLGPAATAWQRGLSDVVEARQLEGDTAVSDLAKDLFWQATGGR